jgi:hypothetical protein
LSKRGNSDKNRRDSNGHQSNDSIFHFAFCILHSCFVSYSTAAALSTLMITTVRFVFRKYSSRRLLNKGRGNFAEISLDLIDVFWFVVEQRVARKQIGTAEAANCVNVSYKPDRNFTIALSIVRLINFFILKLRNDTCRTCEYLLRREFFVVDQTHIHHIGRCN